METEHVDSVRGGRRDEAPNEVVVRGARADEETPPQGEAERRLRPCLERADPLPRALDAAPDGAVEAAAPRHLEVSEARTVQDLGDTELICRRQPTGEGVLAEEADRRVRKARHAGSLARTH